MGPLIAGFFSINTYSIMNVFPLPHDFIINIFFSLAYFNVRIYSIHKYVIRDKYKICVNPQFNVISKASYQQ